MTALHLLNAELIFEVKCVDLRNSSSRLASGSSASPLKWSLGLPSVSNHHHLSMQIHKQQRRNTHLHILTGQDSQDFESFNA